MSVFRRISVGEYLYEGVQDALTAHAGGGQTSAFQLQNAMRFRVSTVATAADSVKLPPAVPGLALSVDNAAALSMQVFGTEGDTINGVATATGVPHAAGAIVSYVCYTLGAWLANAPGLPATKFTTAAKSVGTLAAGDITGAQFSVLQNTGATPGAQTVRTAAQMLADIPGAVAGQSFLFRIVNTGAGTLTLTADVGPTVTLTGTATIAQNIFRDYVLTFNTATTATIQSIGSGVSP